ncbi:MAG: B12-binding domain-containing radical SAM protein [Desulfomonilaceae bacterium]
MLRIVFPPQFEPFQPYLAGAVLVSPLKVAGIKAGFLDLNLAYYTQLCHGEGHSNTDVWFRPHVGSLDRYLSQVHRIEERLRTGHLEGEGLSLHETTFGKFLYDGVRLREFLMRPWAASFRKFLQEHAENHEALLNSRQYAVTLVVHDQLPAAMLLSQFLRIHNPGCSIVWGGPLVSRIREELIKAGFLEDFCDSLVAGPGEEFLASLARGGGISQSAIVSEPGSSPPLPDFSDYPLEEYLSPVPVLPYQVSRGCYWRKCEFCCHYQPFDKFNISDVSTAVTQLAALSEKHGTKYFSFVDECIPAHYLRRLSEQILQRELDIRWFTFARFEPEFDEDTCRLLYEAGCRVLMFGLESAVQRVLDLMNKGTRVENVAPILTACKQAGISVRVDVMIGFPTETRTESENTLRFLLENRAILDTPFSVTPLSRFELQSGAPIFRRPEAIGVKVLGPLRGPLDCQHKYEVETGMGMEETEEQYQRYIQVISKEFRAHARMPENKTHAFLMKCLYSDVGIEDTIFDDAILPDQLEKYRFAGLERIRLSGNADGSSTLECLAGGGRLKLGNGLTQLVSDILKNGCITSPPQDRSDRQQAAEFLTYLKRQNFIATKSSSPSIPSPLLRA